MDRALSMTRRALLAAVLGLAVSACAAHEPLRAPPPIARPGLVQVDVYDRTRGSPLAVYARDGRRYVVGTPGHEYALRIRNTTGGRVLVVTSVDGVNVISGDTAAASQSGYVLEPWGSVEIIGWRKSLERTAAFFFTEHRNSYAARTGRPNDVGVIGVAAFREKEHIISRRDQAIARGQAAPEAESAAGPAGSSADELARQEPSMRPPRASAKLGTGHGRDEASRVTLVQFERATDSPAQTVAIQYDRRENLVAMGVIPAPSPVHSRREPQPFPADVRFVPDP
ncbi:MAG TPA: hypothetical protein VHP37_06275 [Burkholderiales bacterium]|nr:hypothetical protein [Burkholderiales bacterium]